MIPVTNNVDISNNNMENTDDTEPNIENLVNTFTNQVTNTLRQYVTDNIHNNSPDIGVLNFEYVIQTPSNFYTTSSTIPSISSSTINVTDEENDEENDEEIDEENDADNYDDNYDDNWDDLDNTY
jgi:hypothetical protein